MVLKIILAQCLAIKGSDQNSLEKYAKTPVLSLAPESKLRRRVGQRKREYFQRSSWIILMYYPFFQFKIC